MSNAMQSARMASVLAPSHQQYRVQPGESPAAIARKHGVSVDALMRANTHKPTTVVGGKHTFHTLHHGETLNVPVAARMLGDGEQYATVTSTKLNLRASPFADGTIVGGNSQGDIVTVMNWNGAPADSAAPQGWAQVSSPAGLTATGGTGRMSTVDGYMSKQFLSLMNPATPAAPPGMPISMAPGGGIPGLPGLPAGLLPAGYAPFVSIPALPGGALPPPAAPSPATAGQMLAAMLKSGGCAGCGDTSSPLSQATGVFKKASLNDPNCVGIACGNIYGSTYNTQGAAMYAYGPGTQIALSKAIGGNAPPACTDSYGACIGGPSPSPLPSFPIPVQPAVYPAPAPSSGGSGSAKITATKLNIRATPSASGAVVGGNSLGDIVNVLNWNGAPSDSSAPMGWAQVSSPRGLNVDGSPGRSSPVTGYMSKQYLAQEPGKVAPPPPPPPSPVPGGVTQTCPPGQVWLPVIGCQPNPFAPQPAPAPGPDPSIPVQPAKLDTTCPPGQMYVPILGCQPIPILPPLPAPAPAPGPSPAPSPTPTIVSCPPGQVMNPLTGKCWTVPTLPIPFPVLPQPQPGPAPAPAPIQPVPGPTQKAGMSTGTLVAAGLGVAALIGVVAYAATRKKTGHAGKRGKSGHRGKSAHKTSKKRK